jgi:hypothetical protein
MLECVYFAEIIWCNKKQFLYIARILRRCCFAALVFYDFVKFVFKI